MVWDHGVMDRKAVSQVGRFVLFASFALIFGVAGAITALIASALVSLLAQIGWPLLLLGFLVGAVFGLALAILVIEGLWAGIGCLSRWSRNTRAL